MKGCDGTLSYYLSSIKNLNENYSSTYYDIKDIGIKKYDYYYTDRQQIIYILQNFLNNSAFDDYYARWYCEDNSVLNKYTQVKKIYNPYGYMDKIMTELILLSPILKDFNTNARNKLKHLNHATSIINWTELNQEIIETLEMKGDFFAYWYYEISTTAKKGWNRTEDGSYENPIPKIKVLESENLTDITLDSNNKPTAYKYKKSCIAEVMDEETGKIETKAYDIEMIFKEGYIRVNDPHNYPENGFKLSMNKAWESDIIRIIHIPSFKKQGDKFSKIPATKYVDPILVLDALTSDLRYINKLAGFPVAREYDTEVDWGNSSVMPGGRIKCSSTQDALNNGKQGYTNIQQITNNLQTIQDEQSLIDSVLYKKIGLIRERLEEKLGSTDSSRVVSQLRLLLENKFEKYCKNISTGMTPYFKSVLISNSSYTKTDERDEKSYSFAMPDMFINTSVFDDLTITNMKLAIGLTTMNEEWTKQGLTDTERAERLKSIKEEVLMKNPKGDGGGMDNNFKQDTNVEI